MHFPSFSQGVHPLNNNLGTQPVLEEEQSVVVQDVPPCTFNKLLSFPLSLIPKDDLVVMPSL